MMNEECKNFVDSFFCLARNSGKTTVLFVEIRIVDLLTADMEYFNPDDS